ncbi:Transposase IS4 [Popillia japonica]|uniref:Transposase IS4 n=1 Tax=Popillia japonica TaxID=7064 RepID=A0AAW1KG06_POPJA
MLIMSGAKRKTLTLENKAELIKDAEHGITVTKLSLQYGIGIQSVKDVICITAEAWKGIPSGTILKSWGKIRNEAGEENEQILIDEPVVLQEMVEGVAEFEAIDALLSRNGGSSNTSCEYSEIPPIFIRTNENNAILDFSSNKCDLNTPEYSEVGLISSETEIAHDESPSYNLERQHRDEIQVQQFLALNKSDPMRKRIIYKIRKEVAAVNVLNMGNGELEQLATLMGHSTKTHSEWYRLPSDLYQTAKVSKILLLAQNNSIDRYKGCNLNELELEDEVIDETQDESDNESVVENIQDNDLVEERPSEPLPLTRTMTNEDGDFAVDNASDSEDDCTEVASEADDDQVCSDNEDEEGSNNSNYNTPIIEYVSKDGTKWNSEPGKAGKTSHHNIIRGSIHKVVPPPGKVIEDPIDSFNLFFARSVLELIVQHTNSEAYRILQNKWKPIDSIELQTFLGLWLTVGVNKQSNVDFREYWNAIIGNPIFRATMGKNSKTSYPLSGIPYLGKDGDNRAENLAFTVVTKLCEPYHRTNRNVTFDNYFTRLEVAKSLYANGLTMVGTMRKNKRCIPQEFQPSRSRSVGTNIFGFWKNKRCIPQEFQPSRSRSVGTNIFGFCQNITLVSYVPRKYRAVIFLSTMHYTDKVDSEKDKSEGPAQEQSFTKIKCLASCYGLGGALIQEGKDGSREIVAFASRLLSDVEKRYAQIEREALAIIWAAEYFSEYITGVTTLIFETDHKPLIQIHLGGSRILFRIYYRRNNLNF